MQQPKAHKLKKLMNFEKRRKTQKPKATKSTYNQLKPE